MKGKQESTEGTENMEGSSGNRDMFCQRSLLSVIFRTFRGLIQRFPKENQPEPCSPSKNQSSRLITICLHEQPSARRKRSR